MKDTRAGGGGIFTETKRSSRHEPPVVRLAVEVGKMTLGKVPSKV